MLIWMMALIGKHKKTGKSEHPLEHQDCRSDYPVFSSVPHFPMLKSAMGKGSAKQKKFVIWEKPEPDEQLLALAYRMLFEERESTATTPTRQNTDDR